jgi:UDP-N-acetyl-D-galactosamine dehydrogenase
VQRAGGLSRDAYLYGTVFSRESTRVQQQENLNQAIRRMEAQVQAQAATTVQNVYDQNNLANAQAQAAGQRMMLERLRNLKASGRIALEMDADRPELPALTLQDGDSITVPSKPSFVAVFGAVLAENSFIHRSNGTVADYIDKAGPTREADLEAAMLTHKASCIKVAEAAKVIENTQRDVNIALMNELSLIFHKLGIDTLEVLQAAGTKWNFLPFRPGLVGGHCIGVDPYYLTHKAQEVGYHPEVILAGRRINDGMASHVADETIKLMLRKGLAVLGSKVLVLGLTFKENCPDVRNTKVVDIVKALSAYNTQVDVYDPWIDVAEAEHEYGLQCLRQEPVKGQYAAIVLAVGHEQFMAMGEEGLKAYGQAGAVVYDVKSILPLGAADGRL